MNLLVDRIPSPIGAILLVTDGEALRALYFDDYEERMHLQLRRHYGVYKLTSGRTPATIGDEIRAYFDGDLAAITRVPVETGGTAFQRKVWTALREIPAGTTLTYGELAAAIGTPKASRAVGLANGSNPAGIVVPCHRVIGANGTLTGYGGGMERKRWLLTHEGVRLTDRPAQLTLPGAQNSIEASTSEGC
ncbi:MAG: methylated-DNA--[protein]-cysteine S-methyltransferase [Bryobacteraceae bacterium]